jgi:type IV secretion system protein VirB4
MFPEILTTVPTSLITTAIGSAIGIASGAGAMLLAAPKIAEKILPSPKETHLADFLPFASIEPDGTTVRMKSGAAARFVSISGFDQSFLPDAEARNIVEKRKRMFDALAEHAVDLRIFTFRDRLELETEETHANEIATEIAKRWNRNFRNAFVTRNVICISTDNPGPGNQALDEAVMILCQSLEAYGPQVLNQRGEDGDVSALTLGGVLGRIVSPLSRPKPNAFGDGLDQAVCADEVEFLKNGRIRFTSGDETLFASVIGIRRFGDVTSTAMASEIAALNGEIMILQTVEPYAKFKALTVLKQNQMMMSTTAFSLDVANQYAAAIALVDGMDQDKASLCGFSETIFVFGRSEKELKEIEKAVRQILTNYGVTSVIENGATQASWFMQFPGYSLKPRFYRLMSINVAQLATFDKAASGLTKSSWGDGAIAHFYTGANSVYSHQFHISAQPQAVGHGVCIAPTGVGKTTFMEMMSVMASRHKDLKHFFFDRHLGTYIYTTAMNGQYMSFNNEPQAMSIVGGMNPFQCDPSQGNIEFLKVWLRAISRSSGAQMDDQEEADSLDQIAQAVQVAFDAIPREQRSLAAIYEGSFTPGSRLRSALKKWVDPDQYGPMFNAEQDCISLEGNWLTTFDMTKLLDDDVLGGAAVSYIMHRIVETLRRTRSSGLICIEPLLRNQDFRKIFFVMLQEFRKLDAVVLSVFQRPEALKGMGISEAVRQQAGAYYLFPNPGATAKDYDEFDLTPRELGFVLGQTQPARRISRGMLIKRPMTRESVIVDIDFTCLGPYLKFFSSSAKDVALVNDLQRQLGPVWVDRIVDHEAP